MEDRIPPVPQALVNLVEQKYGVKVLNSQYVLVEKQFQKYYLMYEVVLPKDIEEELLRQFGPEGDYESVHWEKLEDSNAYRFSSHIGNHILLMWDELL